MNSSLWVDKYRPSQMDAIKTHRHVTNTLTHMKNFGNMTNLLCYGPSGCGKTTVMLALGNDIYKNTARAKSVIHTKKLAGNIWRVYPLQLQVNF